MATIANWNGHTFEIGPTLIRGFEGMTIKGSCETTDKNTDGQKYLERKYGEKREISLTVKLNALTGVTDVMGEALAYVEESENGACDYFYMGSSKLFGSKMMLAAAEIEEIVTVGGRGDLWISCDVKLTFKQGSKNDGAGSVGGGGGGGGSGGSAHKSIFQVNKEAQADPNAPEVVKKITQALQDKMVERISSFEPFKNGINDVKKVIEKAKSGSASKFETLETLTAKTTVVPSTVGTTSKVTITDKDTKTKTVVTTGKYDFTKAGGGLPKNNK